MIQKQPVNPQRVRRIPRQFSWVDHRVVRDRFIESCSHPAAALYLFLLVVADHQGLSYYSDASLSTRLSMDAPTLERARRNLIEAGLVAFKKPLYQVLDLEPRAESTSEARPAMDRPLSIGRILKNMAEDAR